MAPPPGAGWKEVPRTSFDIERFLGGNWLARVGILVLALGVVFFLKLAYDKEWVPLWGRFAIGVVGGLAIFAAGELLRLRRFDGTYSQILAGGGAVIAYITVYMAWVLPDYRAQLNLSLPAEVVLLALLSGGLGLYAFWRDLPVLAGLAVTLTAILVAPAGAFSNLGLGAIALVGAALLCASALRGWSAVVLTSIVSLNIAIAIGASSEAVDWRLALVCAVLVDGLAVAAAIRSKAPEVNLVRLEAGLAASLLALQGGLALIRSDLPDPFAWSFLVVGVLAAATAFVAGRAAAGLAFAGAGILLVWPMLHFNWELTQVLAYAGLAAAAFVIAGALHAAGIRLVQRGFLVVAEVALALGVLTLCWQALAEGAVEENPQATGALALLLGALGIGAWVAARGDRDVQAGALIVTGFLVLGWPFLQFPQEHWQAVTFAIEGAALLAAALLWPAAHDTLRRAAAVTAAVATVSLLALGIGGATQDHVAILIGATALVAAGAFGSWWASRSHATDRPWRLVALAAGVLAPIVTLGYALSGWPIPVSWAIEALILVAAGLFVRDPELRIASLAAFGLVVGRIFLVDMAGLALPGRVLAFIVTGALLLAASFMYARARRPAEPVPPAPPARP